MGKKKGNPYLSAQIRKLKGKVAHLEHLVKQQNGFATKVQQNGFATEEQQKIPANQGASSEAAKSFNDTTKKLDPSKAWGVLKQFVGKDANGNHAVYLGRNFSGVQHPACELVGSDTSVTWEQKDEVKITIGSHDLEGRVIRVDSQFPWHCFVEITTSESLPAEPPLWKEFEEEVPPDLLLLAKGKSILGKAVEPLTSFFDASGKARGAPQLGDIIARSEGDDILLAGIVYCVEADGESFRFIVCSHQSLLMYEEYSQCLGGWWEEHPELLDETTRHLLRGTD